MSNNEDDVLSDLDEEEVQNQVSVPRRRRDEQDDDGDNDMVDEDPAAAQRREIERRMDEALKSNRQKKKLGEDDLEQMQDEKMAQLREKMHNAAVADADCIRNGTSATHKLKLLPQVKSVLQKHNLADSILDNNMLEVMRMWLEPLPDASLPAFAIQKELFTACDRLPIKSIHLRESGLGKVVLFYQRSKRPQLEIKRLADKLIGDWTRPIMGRSDNYRDKYIATAEYNPDFTGGATSSNAVNLPKRSGGTSVQEAAAMRRNRAHIPTAKAVQYDVAPKSIVQANASQGDDGFKSLRRKLQQRNIKGTGTGSKKKNLNLD